MAHTHQLHRFLILKWVKLGDELWRIMRKEIASELAFCTVFDGDVIICWSYGRDWLSPQKMTATASVQWTDPTHSVSKVSNFNFPPPPPLYIRSCHIDQVSAFMPLLQRAATTETHSVYSVCVCGVHSCNTLTLKTLTKWWANVLACSGSNFRKWEVIYCSF